MMRRFPFGIALALIALALLAASASAAPIVFSAAGLDAASIQATVDAYRAALGDPNNGNAAGPLPSGRREINWDGGGTATSPAGDPFAGFLNNRGALFDAGPGGTGFVQAPPSGGAGGGLATFFSNPTYGTIFTTFSAPRLFSPIDTNVHDTTFFIPGSNGTISATVTGFGAVFADVDLANTSSIQYFDSLGNSLGTFSVPVFNNGLSFLGVLFDAGELVFSVRITTGNSPLGPNDGSGVDVVALDDFLYAEPQGLVVPEPAGLTLLGLGALALAARQFLAKRRKRSLES
jgi:type II secretory pathway pseudopilin PulG